MRPSFASKWSLFENRGRREGRVPADTHGSRAIKKHGEGTTGSAGWSRPSLRNGVTAYTRSPRGPGFLAPVAREPLVERPAGLASASGGQDHTTSPSASAPFVRANIISHAQPMRPSHPAANVRDDRETPLMRRRDGADHLLIWGRSQEMLPKIEINPAASE
jgi:hypothetical protein